MIIIIIIIIYYIMCIIIHLNKIISSTALTHDQVYIIHK